MNLLPFVHDVHEPVLYGHVPRAQGLPHGGDALGAELVNVVDCLKVQVFPVRAVTNLLESCEEF